MQLMHLWILLQNVRLALLHHERRLGDWKRAGTGLHLAGRTE